MAGVRPLSPIALISHERTLHVLEKHQLSEQERMLEITIPTDPFCR